MLCEHFEDIKAIFPIWFWLILLITFNIIHIKLINLAINTANCS